MKTAINTDEQGTNTEVYASQVHWCDHFIEVKSLKTEADPHIKM